MPLSALKRLKTAPYHIIRGGVGNSRRAFLGTLTLLDHLTVRSSTGT
jgi:hypothetical protein